jgi:L-lactate utilization protein LutC
LADVDVAIVRASFAVAETGSVLLSEENIGITALVYLAQYLVVLLDHAASFQTFTMPTAVRSSRSVGMPLSIPVLPPPPILKGC